MKNHKVIDFHSCYDELLSKLLIMPYETQSDNTSEKSSCYFVDDNGNSNSDSLTAHEIIIYSLLLHNCIESGSEKGTISYSELQQLRGKRVGKAKILDDDTLQAYGSAIIGLAKKRIKYDLKESRKNYKITYRQHEHPLLILKDTETLTTGDGVIKYSLGPFGKTLMESKRYSTLIPKKYFQIQFKEIIAYQIALYICKIIYLERRKKSGKATIKLTSIMKNISKFINSEDGLVQSCCGLNYSGPNVKRFWDVAIKRANEIFSTLKQELKIEDYKSNYGISINSKDHYQEIKWIVYFNNQNSKVETRV